MDKAQATPWPNEMNMRQGLLFQLEGSMSGVGDVGVIGEGEEIPTAVGGVGPKLTTAFQRNPQTTRRTKCRSCRRTAAGASTLVQCSSSIWTRTSRTTTRWCGRVKSERETLSRQPATVCYFGRCCSTTMLYACRGTPERIEICGKAAAAARTQRGVTVRGIQEEREEKGKLLSTSC